VKGDIETKRKNNTNTMTVSSNVLDSIIKVKEFPRFFVIFAQFSVLSALLQHMGLS